ncbi:hypothetical protein SCOCK_90002 [Actinacidiphila cocklensis]|uniref:Uncharacterized protein n=1 Tax=Actinacidiphila cocklensis TaxID=887465 RepID=A0A9W4E4Z7_9ACTN|nr:hypothetical protein SCOCK_90002 [Actinacidiphila cocklensis]
MADRHRAAAVRGAGRGGGRRGASGRGQRALHPGRVRRHPAVEVRGAGRGRRVARRRRRPGALRVQGPLPLHGGRAGRAVALEAGDRRRDHRLAGQRGRRGLRLLQGPLRVRARRDEGDRGVVPQGVAQESEEGAEQGRGRGRGTGPGDEAVHPCCRTRGARPAGNGRGSGRRTPLR